MKKCFILIGDGQIAKHHRSAIESIGGKIVCVVDPKYDPVFNKDTYRFIESVPEYKLNWADYFVICSETQFHRQQISFLLNHIESSHKESQIICEKPAFMPWEPVIESERLNIVLQLRYLPDLPKKADLVKAIFVRDKEYFKSWKGDARKTGGLFVNLFIHYIDLAILLDADFEGMVLNEGKQEKKILSGYTPESLEMVEDPESARRKELEAEKISYQTPIGAQRYNEKTDSYFMDLYNESFRHIDYGTWDYCLDILKIDMQECYNRLYEDIISGGGIKPKDIFYLSWILERNSEIFGYGKNSIGKIIKIGKELL